MAAAETGDGHSKKFCGAKKRQGEGNCTRPAGWGTDHAGSGRCKFHGGSTRSLRVAAAKEQAAVEWAKLDASPVDDPLTALSVLAGRVVAWTETLGAKVNELTSVRSESMLGVEQLRSEVALFERALDRCNAVLSSMARLNIDERLAKVSERQAQMVTDALAAVLVEMGLSHEQQREARTRVARHLRVASG